ncbi:tRNA adenosine(34) deaminase TadA [Brochothrix campestris]|uniref:tRNA-specific adenosine deaminase n=1 Tax=Brochothrix campestris FSL F6-1037 TaxID=1265861 RepID=W7CGI1_9LIST|nr:tRNA adenosine(34) deaminase TadA [Brochothrix campestris]EUJ36027.1 tRNA specific adenosine deaminase [Brochothrix campestris FSL F6-1037]
MTKIEEYMKVALAEAEKAKAIGEVPIGAIVVHNDRIVGRGHNLRETSQDATSHAEVLAIQAACRAIGSWRLEECDIYVTLEPCPMCSGALILARMRTVYYGAADVKAGTAGTLMNLLTDERFNHQCEVHAGVLEEECGQILTDFFRAIRLRQKEAKRIRRLSEQIEKGAIE